MALVKRLVKGGPLTFAEGDGNLDYLEGLATAVKSWDDIVSKPITGSNAIAYISSSSVIASAVTGSYQAAFFDYVVTYGSNSRAGTVMSHWNGSSIVYTDVATTDIGNTSQVTMSVDLDGGDTVQLKATTTEQWFTRVLTRLI